MVHCDAFWYCRSLPGVLAGFAAAYGTDDLVTAYDRMAINRPVECGEESVAELEAAALQNPFMRIRGLHTHYDQVRPPFPLPLRRLFRPVNARRPTVCPAYSPLANA